MYYASIYFVPSNHGYVYFTANGQMESNPHNPHKHTINSSEEVKLNENVFTK